MEQHRLEIDKYWSETLSVMTEDENGRIRANDEKILRGMFVVEFFIKLTVFKERMDLRLSQLKNLEQK